MKSRNIRRMHFLSFVSNPLDAMTQVAFRRSGFPKNRVMGMAGVLDSARMRCFLGRGVECFGRERHGVCARRPRRHDGAAAAIFHLCRHPDHRTSAKDQIDAIIKRTANGGAEIVGLLKTGSAYYAPSLGAVEMAEAS